MLWHRDLDATPIGDKGSDRMCRIRFQADEGTKSVISLIGVYMPCLNLRMEYYQDQLVDLQRIVLESKALGPVIVMGDFNATCVHQWVSTVVTLAQMFRGFF